MYVKKHASTTGRTVIAVCDEDLLGKTIIGKDIQITVSEHFYKGEQKTADELKAILQIETDFNLIGTETIQVGLALGIITKEHILMIDTVPHAIVFAL